MRAEIADWSETPQPQQVPDREVAQFEDDPLEGVLARFRASFGTYFIGAPAALLVIITMHGIGVLVWFEHVRPMFSNIADRRAVRPCAMRSGVSGGAERHPQGDHSGSP